MAGREEKVSVELDAEMVERARVQLGLDRASDATVVERALNAYLLGGLLDGTQASAGLTEHDAERTAHEELRSSRRERGAARSASSSIQASPSRRSAAAAAAHPTKDTSGIVEAIRQLRV